MQSWLYPIYFFPVNKLFKKVFHNFMVGKHVPHLLWPHLRAVIKAQHFGFCGSFNYGFMFTPFYFVFILVIDLILLFFKNLFCIQSTLVNRILFLKCYINKCNSWSYGFFQMMVEYMTLSHRIVANRKAKKGIIINVSIPWKMYWYVAKLEYTYPPVLIKSSWDVNTLWSYTYTHCLLRRKQFSCDYGKVCFMYLMSHDTFEWLFIEIICRKHAIGNWPQQTDATYLRGRRMYPLSQISVYHAVSEKVNNKAAHHRSGPERPAW